MPGKAFFGSEMGDHRWKVWMDAMPRRPPRSVIDSHIQNLAWLKHSINDVIFVH